MACVVCAFYSGVSPGSWELHFVTLCESFQPQRKDTAIYVQEKILITPTKQQVCSIAQRLKTTRVVLTTLCKVTFLLD